MEEKRIEATSVDELGWTGRKKLDELREKRKKLDGLSTKSARPFINQIVLAAKDMDSGAKEFLEENWNELLEEAAQELCARASKLHQEERERMEETYDEF